MSESNTVIETNATNLFHSEPPQILITGGVGFIGSHLADAVLKWFPAAEITIVDAFTYAANPENLRSAVASGRISIVHGSIQDQALMERIIMPGAIIFHLAAESHVPRSFSDPDLFDRVNRGGTAAIMAAALIADANRVIHFSTAEVYGNRLNAADENQPFAPTTPYARSKANGEFEVMRARQAGLDVAIVRPGNTVGLRQHPEKMLPVFLRQALTGQPLTIEGDGQQLRTFLNVAELVSAIKLIMQKGNPNGTYNIDGPETYSVLEVADLVSEIVGSPHNVRHMPDRRTNDRACLLDGRRLAALGFCPATLLRTTIGEILETMDKTQLFDAPPMVPNLGGMDEDKGNSDLLEDIKEMATDGQ